ncbi:DNA translocase FtsK [Aminobacter anthyllidis]|uniref:DNA translocase FtsK n=1 Tax=Aminobacter anthyllidis TaxID=1035067 RepID=UPI0024580D6D|nr:DNA translocase FtsK [Aminobacter anthyllidis]MDH4984023.1 DNA translocase FtsK [Aminobacter anthyllidis]
MGSTRLPRVNLSNQVSHNDGPDRPESAPLPSPADGPGWQDYFFLAPNVRFTRTPDYDAAKRQAYEAAEAAHNETQANVHVVQPQATERMAAPVATHAPARPATVTTGAQVVEALQAQIASRIAAQAVQAPSPARQPAAAVQQPTAAPMQSAAKPAAAGESPATQPKKARWSYLSDHAFFELMAPNTSDGPAPAAPVVAARPAPVQARVAPVVTRQAEVPAAEITALFRVIECIPPQQANTAPAAPANSNEAKLEAPAIAERDQPVPVVEAESASVVEPVAPVRAASPLPLMGRIVPATTGDAYELPSEELLQLPPEGQGFYMSQERLEQNADLLESVLEDFGVRGEIIHVRPGPVVTLYEFEPAPGVKSSRVIGLADDIARSMSAISARVAVIPGRNVIGIELPNETRETVYFRELIESDGFRNTSCKLALCLGKTIGGEPVIAELAKMPHLLVAGTTGSGKSVAINTMILSLLYRLKPEECRLIMVDPKMLELSIYDGIPHLLTPVVTDPKKAVTALKWAVREMEDRYRKMARLGVRNIDGYNERAAIARDKGETVVMQVQTGFEKGTGVPLFEEQEIDLAPMPYIVVIVDEMADLMMVAGKEIEGAIQRLAQMARAAGIHLIMATQRPSVDVITGTIKANFPTRISFQVTSKIDSRTILGEQGAEQLLGQGDMLHMAGGGRISRVHGPFVSDAEVEHVVTHLKAQGRPEYLETVTADEDDEVPEVEDTPVFDKGAVAAEDGDSIYDEAVKVVQRDKKCSTSYIQRRLGIGYNRAASLVERMEKEGLVGAPNHVGKREIMAGRRDNAQMNDDQD